MRTLFVIAVTYASFWTSGEAVSCYVCSTCAQPYSNPISDVTSGCGYCQNSTTQQVSGLTVVSRACMSGSLSVYRCQAVTVFGITITTCTCDGNDCNTNVASITTSSSPSTTSSTTPQPEITSTTTGTTGTSTTTMTTTTPCTLCSGSGHNVPRGPLTFILVFSVLRIVMI